MLNEIYRLQISRSDGVNIWSDGVISGLLHSLNITHGDKPPNEIKLYQSFPQSLISDRPLHCQTTQGEMLDQMFPLGDYIFLNRQYKEEVVPWLHLYPVLLTVCSRVYLKCACCLQEEILLLDIHSSRLPQQSLLVYCGSLHPVWGKLGCSHPRCATESFVTDLFNVAPRLSGLSEKERASERVNNVVVGEASILTANCKE